jgi:hypothetical protein
MRNPSGGDGEQQQWGMKLDEEGKWNSWTQKEGAAGVTEEARARMSFDGLDCKESDAR